MTLERGKQGNIIDNFDVMIFFVIRCTAVFDTKAECTRKAELFTILPPVVSCKIKTKQTFTFKYGKVEIRAKLPRGDW